MSAFPGSPKVLKGGIVLLDPDRFTVLPNGIIVLQYNPDTLTRTLKIKGGDEGGDRSEALRLTGPPVETIKLDAEIDATDQLEISDATDAGARHLPAARGARDAGLSGQRRRCSAISRLAQQGTLEIMPMLAPLTLFVWSANRIVPVRLTDFTITEEAFDPALNPLRAKVSLGMRVLSIDDSRLQRQGRQPLHDLSAAEGDAGAPDAGRHVRRARHSRHPMSTLLNIDPVQAILAQTALRNTLFAPTSRYYGLDTATLARPGGAPIVYLRRRFVPPPIALPDDPGAHGVAGRAARQHRRAAISATPTLFWRLCDANEAMRPDELTETPGRRTPHHTARRGSRGHRCEPGLLPDADAWDRSARARCRSR